MTNYDKKCDLCRKYYERPSELRNICRQCCKHLGGGKYSARGLQAEVQKGAGR